MLYYIWIFKDFNMIVSCFYFFMQPWISCLSYFLAWGALVCPPWNQYLQSCSLHVFSFNWRKICYCFCWIHQRSMKPVSQKNRWVGSRKSAKVTSQQNRRVCETVESGKTGIFVTLASRQNHWVGQTGKSTRLKSGHNRRGGVNFWNTVKK